MRCIFGFGTGIIKFNYQKRVLIMNGILNDNIIDFKFIQQNAGKIDKLICDNVLEINNINKENLPFIKECYFFNRNFYKNKHKNIITFDKLYLQKEAINMFNCTMKPDYTYSNINEISKTDIIKYSKLLRNIRCVECNYNRLLEYQFIDIEDRNKYLNLIPFNNLFNKLF